MLTVTEDGFPYAAALAPMLYSEAMAQYANSTGELQRLAREENLAAAGRLRDAKFEATGLLLEGDPAHQIVKVARAREAGLIVLGTRGQTGLRRLILGSVARNVLLHAPCSVLVVREPASPMPSESVQREQPTRSAVAADHSRNGGSHHEWARFAPRLS